MASEMLKRDARISELKQVVRQIQCSCEEAEVQAANAFLISQTPVCARYSFQDTVSEYELALSHLQEKCKQKDRMIAVMVQELRSRSNNKLYDQMLQALAMSPSTDRDFNRTEICNSLRRPSSDLYSGQHSRNTKEIRRGASRINIPTTSRNPQVVEQFRNVKRLSSRERTISKSLQTSNIRLHGPIISPHPGYRSCSCGDVDEEYPSAESDERNNQQTDVANYSCDVNCLNKALQTPDTLAKDVAVCSHPNFPNCACYQSTLPECLHTEFSDCKDGRPSLKELKDVSTECSDDCRNISETVLEVHINDLSKECFPQCKSELHCEDMQYKMSGVSAKEGKNVNYPTDQIAKTCPLSETASVSRDSTGPCGDVQSKRSLKKVVNIAKDIQKTSSKLEDASICLHPNYPNCPCESSEDLLQNSTVCLHPNYPNCPCDSKENVLHNSSDEIKECTNNCELASQTTPCTSASNSNCLTSCELNSSDKNLSENPNVWKVLPFIEDSQSKISIKMHKEAIDSYETPMDSFSSSHEHSKFPEKPVLQQSLCVPGCSSNPERCENDNFPNCPCSGKNKGPISPSQVPERELVSKTYSPAVLPEASSSPRRSTLLASGSSNYPLFGSRNKQKAVARSSVSSGRVRTHSTNRTIKDTISFSSPLTETSSAVINKERKFSRKSLCTTGCSSNPDKCEHADFPECPCSDNTTADVLKRSSLQDSVTFSPPEKPQQGDASLLKRSSSYRSSRVSMVSKKSSIPGPIHKSECCKEKKDEQVRRPMKTIEGMCNCKCPSVCPIHGGEESEIIPDKCPRVFDTGSPIKITEVRRLSPDGLIIKWSTRSCECYKGYEVEIDGVVKSRVYSPRRTSTVLHALTLTNSVEILVYAIAPDGRYGLPAKAVF